MSSTAFATERATYKASTSTLAEPFPAEVDEVFTTLEGLGSDDEQYLPNDVRPTPETVDWAKEVLLRVLPRKYLFGARIEPFNGEIHVNWEGATKRVVAFLPQRDELKVYNESIQNMVAVNPVLKAPATPGDLCEILRWFFQ